GKGSSNNHVCICSHYLCERNPIYDLHEPMHRERHNSNTHPLRARHEQLQLKRGLNIERKQRILCLCQRDHDFQRELVLPGERHFADRNWTGDLVEPNELHYIHQPVHRERHNCAPHPFGACYWQCYVDWYRQ
ncbi:hypothetical protein B0A55_13793, partial [Friedmanniomyces simplex]